MRHGICRTLSVILVLLSLGPLAARAHRPNLPPVTIEADHVMGKTEKPKPKPQIAPEILAQVEILLDQALGKLAHGRYEKARALLSQAKKLHPNHPGVLKASARSLLTLGYLKWNEAMALEAKADLARARKLSPDDMGLVELERLVLNLVSRIQRLKKPKTRTK